MDQPWLNFYEPGVPAEIPYPEGMLAHHLLERSAERFPNRPAIIFPAAVGKNLLEGRLSYRDLERASNCFANALIQLGIVKGDRVVLLLPNSPQFLIALFGALKAGAAVVALNPQAEPAELERQLEECRAETVVTMTAFYAAVKRAQANTLVTRVITTNIKEYFHPLARALYTMTREKRDGFRAPLNRRDYSFRLMLRGANETRPEVELSPDDLALVQYTAGSTGPPKPASLTHRQLVANCLQLAAWRTEAEAGHEAALCLVPFFQLYGMQVALLNNLYLGAALILFARFDMEHVLTAIDKYHPTVLIGTPLVYDAMLNDPAIHKYDLRSIRLAWSGAAALPPELMSAFEDLSGGELIEAYGLTEAGPLTHVNPIHGTRKPGSIGLPLPDTRARIVEPEFPLVEVPVAEVGELAIQGPQVFGGYWNRSVGAARAFADGWLLTGDLARMDQDGFFYFVERKQDVIIMGGYRIFPREVEQVLFKHPQVQDCAVIGVPDHYMGQVPKAFVVLQEGETATEEEILDYLHHRLARFQVPRHVEFRDSLPKTIGGEVLRYLLVEEEQAQADAILTS